MKLIVKLKNGIDIWNVNAKCRALAQPIANRLGLSLKEFLTGVSRWQLPTGSGPRREYENDLKDDPSSVPAGFQVKQCKDSSIWQRIERAAQFDKITVELFIWKAVASSVVCLEADLITDPKDGTPLGNAMELAEFRTRVFTNERRGPRRTGAKVLGLRRRVGARRISAVVKMFPFVFLLAAALMLSGCGSKAAENRKIAEQKKERSAQEFQEYRDAKATRNAPVIAARHNLTVDLVKRILLFNQGEQTRAIERFATSSKPQELAPDQSAMLDTLAAQEHIERRTIGNILFDNAVLNCEDKDSGD